MKRGLIVLLLVALTAASTAVWWWACGFPQPFVDLLVEVGLALPQAQELVPEAIGGAAGEEGEPLLASGSIEGEQVAIVSEFGGRITKISVREGDVVEKGQIVVELDRSSLLAEKAQAQAAVTSARANLEQVRSGAHPAEILAAKAVLDQAIAERDAALRAWQDAQAVLKLPQEIESRVVQARGAVDLSLVGMEQAKAQIAKAEVERDRYLAQGSMEEKWLYRLYDYQVEAAVAALQVAQADHAGALASLRLLQEMKRNPLALLSQTHALEGSYGIAEAGVAVAEAALAELQAGATPEEVAVAQAQVMGAEAALSVLDLQIEKMTLRSPISGVVVSRSAHSGEAALPGAVLLTVADLSEVDLTVYVPEAELGRVFLGQEVEVQIDSFPGQPFTGTITYISQQAEFTPKNVQTEQERVNMVFAVKVHMLNPGHVLKAGLPADAVFWKK